jgi:peptide/nickel transport system substrate-binding protein
MMFLSTGRNRALAAVALASSMTLVVAGCSSSGAGAGGGEGEDRVLNVFAGSQTPITANFNPYSPTALHASSGAIYETLYYYNKGAAGDPTPLLGESFAFDDTGS